MPPSGKPQPTADDIALLTWWVKAGAPGDKKVADLQPSADIQRLLEARFSRPAQTAQAKPAPPQPASLVMPLAAQLGDALEIALGPLSRDEPWLQCNAGIAGTNFTDAELARLDPLASNLRWLDLAGTAVSDTGLEHVAAMNALCPVSGKPVDPAKTVFCEGRLTAFCCDDCRTKFQQDPKPFLQKLGRAGSER